MATGLVESTERLYRALFAIAVGYALATSAWGLILAPFNHFQGDHLRESALMSAATIASALTFRFRRRVYYLLRRVPAWTLAITAAGVLVQWADGGWHSTAYLASYSGIVMAAVTGGVRWSLVCGLISAAGYFAGYISTVTPSTSCQGSRIRPRSMPTPAAF